MIQELGYRYGKREVYLISPHGFFNGIAYSQPFSMFSIDQAPYVDRHILIQLCNIIDRFGFMWIL
jgi:hypothetical protein